MKLPWIKDRTAAIPELREQLSAATLAHAEASGAVELALEKFLETGDDADNRALQKMKQAAELAEHHVRRATDLLKKAEDAQAAADRAAAATKAKELGPQLTVPAIREAALPLAQSEADAIFAHAEVILARIAQRDALRGQARELEMALHACGDEIKQRLIDEADARVQTAYKGPNPDLAVSPEPVRELIDAKIATLPVDSPLRVVLERMKPTGRDYEARRSVFVMPQAPAVHVAPGIIVEGSDAA